MRKCALKLVRLLNRPCGWTGLLAEGPGNNVHINNVQFIIAKNHGFKCEFWHIFIHFTNCVLICLHSEVCKPPLKAQSQPEWCWLRLTSVTSCYTGLLLCRVQWFPGMTTGRLVTTAVTAGLPGCSWTERHERVVFFSSDSKRECQRAHFTKCQTIPSRKN